MANRTATTHNPGKCMSSIKKLIKAIKDKKKITHIEVIVKGIKDLNGVYEGETPLEALLRVADMRSDALDVFKLLIKFNANPFFKHDDKPSAVESIADDNLNAAKDSMRDWLCSDKDSPIFTWEKMQATQPALYKKFVAAGLIPKKFYINELPIHVAIEAAIKTGEMGLIQEVLKAAGDTQRAGNVAKTSILVPAISAACRGKKNGMEVLKYLLMQKADPLVTNYAGSSAIFQAISCSIIEQLNEDDFIAVIQLLLQHNASIAEKNRNSTLMAALKNRRLKVFAFLLVKATPELLNQEGRDSPYYVVFKILDNELQQQDTVSLLSYLKSKGVEFNKTINYNPMKGASLLHYYVEQMASAYSDNLIRWDRHLEIIQALVANGADPSAKATYIPTNEKLTASEYARKSIKQLFRLSSNFPDYEISTYRNEADFLQSISCHSKETQQRLHKNFHDFRNLERALSGQPILPYAGLPDLGKVLKNAEQAKVAKTMKTDVAGPKSVAKVEDVADIEQRLLAARRNQDKTTWQALKKSMVDAVKTADNPEEFMAKILSFKKLLQLHFDVVVDPKTNTETRGSFAYRLFHVFDKNKFATSWEGLRKYGWDTFGVDVNTEYDAPKMGAR